MGDHSLSAFDKQTGEAKAAAPDSVDLSEAVALMGDESEGDPGATEEAGGDDAGDTAGGEAPDGEEAGDEEAEDDSAPEFWSAEDKAAWKDVPAELRPVLRKYEQQRLEFVNEKAREAAGVRAQSAEQVKRATATLDLAAAWWRHNGPAFQKAVADRWSQVDWKTLAEKEPAEYARLNEQRQQEQAVLAEAHRRGQEEIQAAQARAEQAFQESKSAEHAKLAAKLPDYFGAPETAAKTYEELGRFLSAKGIPADRINLVHEAPIIELALNAMRFEQAQKHALRSRQGGRAGTTARATPTRVAPGPASSAPSQARAGNRTSDAARQVGERFRRSGGSSIADAAELIRLSGL